MARRARPTLRCLRDDLGQAVPRADTPLDEIEHPLLVKAVGQFTSHETPHERIAAIDDQVLLKVKVQRWRGAVWIDGDGDPWLVSAGRREDGSPDDFYASLAAQAKTARSGPRYPGTRRPGVLHVCRSPHHRIGSPPTGRHDPQHHPRMPA